MEKQSIYQTIDQPIYQNINDAARHIGVSAYYIRKRIQDRNIDFIMTGSKYMVNVPKLLQQLEIEGENRWNGKLL